jgi:hypothetical protein
LAAANRRLRERVVKVASEQTISGSKSSFGSLLPANFTTFSGFVGRVARKLAEAQTPETDNRTMHKLLWLQNFVEQDQKQRGADSGQYLKASLLARNAQLSQQVTNMLVIKYQQMLYSTQQYLFEMIPVGAPQTGVPSFYGLCDSTNLRFCTQEMYDNQMCRCIESYEDLKNQVKFAIMDAHKEFEGISFMPLDNILGAATESISNSVSKIVCFMTFCLHS